MEIRSDCPTNCKYISGDKCIASECYKRIRPTIIPCDDVVAQEPHKNDDFVDVAEFAKRGEELRKYGTLEVCSDTFLIEDITVHTNCIVCGKDVTVDMSKSYGSHICDKCKSAILKIRKMLEEQDDERRY